MRSFVYLTLVDEQQVDVLQFGADRVTLNILHASLELLTINLDHQNNVLVTNSHSGRVAGEDHVLRLFTIAVDNGGDITNSADAACIALTEIGAGSAVILISDMVISIL